MEEGLLKANAAVDYHAALQPYGFDFFNFDGDKYGQPDQGYHVDRYYSGEAIRWLRIHAHQLRGKGQPFFMAVSFLNPHDIMYADANIPGEPPVQKALVNSLLTIPPENTIYQKKWNFTSAPGIQESLMTEVCHPPLANTKRNSLAHWGIFRPAFPRCGVVLTTTT